LQITVVLATQYLFSTALSFATTEWSHFIS